MHILYVCSFSSFRMQPATQLQQFWLCGLEDDTYSCAPGPGQQRVSASWQTSSNLHAVFGFHIWNMSVCHIGNRPAKRGFR